MTHRPYGPKMKESLLCHSTGHMHGSGINLHAGGVTSSRALAWIVISESGASIHARRDPAASPQIVG